MMMRIVAIILTGLALWALWFSYNNLNVFRRTIFWEFRYFIFVIGAFLGLSAIEWVLGWVQKTLNRD